MNSRQSRVAVLTGASGYVGGLILEEVCATFSTVRCVSRDPSKLTDLPPNAIPTKADLLEFSETRAALEDADIAFYFAHSMADSDQFSELEERSASNFSRAANEAGISKIIYLGGLAQGDSGDSAHMKSRHVVGDILRSSGIPVIEFRASVVIGAGSMPFEAIRALVNKLPVMITPKWVREQLQPIWSGDLKSYLIEAATLDFAESATFEIGGSEVISYRDLLHIYAKERGLRRWMINVPVVTPSLSSHWLRIFTPAHYKIGRQIVESATHRSIVRDFSAKEVFSVKPIGAKEAVTRALQTEQEDLAFLDSVPHQHSKLRNSRWIDGTRFIEKRTHIVNSDHETASIGIKKIGGQYGWYWATWMWRLRGAMDRVVGGVGYRNTRPAGDLKTGSQMDFWKVVRVSNSRLTLAAEMKLPGEAFFDLKVERIDPESTCPVKLIHTVSFDPKGLLGFIYWYGLFPIHKLVFDRMAQALASRIEIEPHGR